MSRLVYIITQVLCLSALLHAQAPDDAPPPDLLEQARRVALNYTDHLPDFLCTQSIQRFEAYGPQGNFRNTDTLTVQVAYFQLHENYKLIARNNKPTKQKLESIGGATSEGEFGSTLLLIFHPKTQAEFAFKEWVSLKDRRLAVYTYRVDRDHSHWELKFGPLQVMAAYHGELFIDPLTKSVLRIVENVDVPSGFPVQYTNTTLDYDFVDVGGREYLLPIRSETVSADFPSRMRNGQRSTPGGLLANQMRYRNVSDFRDYRKYAAESTLTFDTGK